MRNRIAATFIICFVVLLLSGSDQSQAQSRYDGFWSVLIVSERGPCDQAYRYGLQIQSGRIYYGGGAGVNVSGQVGRNGSVRVTVAAGGQRADGTGRLFDSKGEGRWRGQSSTDFCSGYWIAERRG